ncbi:MAG: hypothetical protein ABSB59_16990 [Streptosporangiaceae bacterium]
MAGRGSEGTPAERRSGPGQHGPGRPERRLDPDDGPLSRFAYELRQVRAAAGYPSYRDLSRTALFSASVLSAAAGGSTFPSLQVTLAYAGACGGDTGEWQRRWEATAAALGRPAPAVTPPARPGAAQPGPARAGRTGADHELSLAELLETLVDGGLLQVAPAGYRVPALFASFARELLRAETPSRSATGCSPRLAG